MNQPKAIEIAHDVETIKAAIENGCVYLFGQGINRKRVVDVRDDYSLEIRLLQSPDWITVVAPDQLIASAGML